MTVAFESLTAPLTVKVSYSFFCREKEREQPSIDSERRNRKHFLLLLLRPRFFSFETGLIVWTESILSYTLPMLSPSWHRVLALPLRQSTVSSFASRSIGSSSPHLGYPLRLCLATAATAQRLSLKPTNNLSFAYSRVLLSASVNYSQQLHFSNMVVST